MELYTALIEDPIDISAHPFDLIPNLIKQEDNNLLTTSVTMNELKGILSIMKPDSAPGPNGFTTRFFTSCWSIIKHDLRKMVRHSQLVNRLGGSTNSSFLALIPKEKGANTFNRFRTISLCNTGYKIITKIIASRLKRILPKIIPEN